MFSVVLVCGKRGERQSQGQICMGWSLLSEHRTKVLFAVGLLILSSLKEGWLGKFLFLVLEISFQTSSVHIQLGVLDPSGSVLAHWP